MASNLQRFGGFIGDKVKGAASDFAFGAKSAVYSANPALFSGMESGIGALKKEFSRTREQDNRENKREQAEQKRQRGFQEENNRERKYAELQQQKIFESMDDKLEKILNALLKNKDDDSLLGGMFPIPLGFRLPSKPGGKLPSKPDGKPPKVPGIDGKTPPKIVDPEFKKLRLRGLGVFDDIVKSFEKMKTSLFKTSTRFPELERYATKMSGDMSKSVKAIEDMSGSIKASRESLLAKFGPQYGKGGKALSGAALDSRLGKLAGADATFDVAKGADATFDVAKGADAAGDASKFKNILNMDVGKLFGEMYGKFVKLLEGPLRFISTLSDVGPLIKGIGKVAGPLSVLIGIYDGLMNSFDTEQLQETLSKTDITIGDRFAGFIGGFIGSIGGLFDLLLGIMGIQYEGESIQDFLTNGITKLTSFSFEAIGDYFKLVGAYFEGIYGLVAGDQERIQNSKDKFEYLGEKWFGWTDDFGRIVGGMIANSIEDIKLSLNIMKETIVGIFENLMLDISILGDKLAKKGNEIWNGGRVAIALAVNGVVDTVRSMINWVIDAINEITNSIIDAIPDSIFGVSLTSQKSSAKTSLKINRLEKTSDVIDGEAIQKEHRAQQAALDAAIAEKTNAKVELANQTLANIKRLEADSAETKLQMASANNAAQAERDAKAAARQEELGIKTGFTDSSDPNIPSDEQLPTKADTKDQTEAITEASKEGTVEIVDTTIEISEEEKLHQQRLADAAAAQQEELNTRMREEYSRGVDKMLAGQSELVRGLLGPLLKGQEGGGPLGTIFKNIFGNDSPLGGIGDALGNLLGKGKGGLFDSVSGFFKNTFGGLEETVSEFTNLFKVSGGGTSVGKSIFSTPGFGGGTGGMDPLTALLGSTVTEKLGLSGVGANAAFDVTKSLLTPGTGMAGIKGALAGPGGFAGGLGAIMSIFNGDSTTLGGALSGGLGIYQLFKGGGLSNMLGGGVAKLGAQLFAGGSAGVGSSVMGFGSGMQNPSMLFDKNALLSERLGAGVGTIGTGMTSYAIAKFISGGYTANKYLNKIAAAVSMIPGVGPIAGVIAGAINRLFGRKEKEYKDYGLDLNLGTETSGQQYKDWVKKGGVYRSDKKGTDYENLDKEMLEGLSEAALSVQEGYGALAKIMGLSAESISGFTKQYKISLKDLSPQEQQKKIAELIQTYADDAIKASYGNVSRFAIEGEKTTDTFARMAGAVENVAYWFDALGYTAEQTADMFSKMVDSEGLLTASSAGFFNANWMDSPYYQKMLEEFGGDYAGGGRGAYSQYFTGGMTNMFGGGIPMNMYGQGQQGTFEPTEEQKKLAIAGAKANFIEMFGGEENFGKTMQSYFSSFYSQEEQAEFMARQATIQAQAALESVNDQLKDLSEQFTDIDPNLAASLEGITSQKQIDEAKQEYRKAIEAAMEAGDMELAAELLQSSDVFMQAANLQLQAAEMNGNATKENISLFSDLSEFSTAGDSVIALAGTKDTPIPISAENIGNQFLGYIKTSPPPSQAEAVVPDQTEAVVAAAAANPAVISGSGNVDNSSVNNNVSISNASVRDYHPHLGWNVRDLTFGYFAAAHQRLY